MIRRLLTHLEYGGYEVVAAHSGVDAIHKLAEHRSIVTASHDLDLAMSAMAAGAIGFIPKPFKPTHLLTVVERALERRTVRHHHEHYDGSGYPDGLRGSAIPVGARIVSVVDAFDVMRSGRPYSPPRPLPATVEELRRLRGVQFDGDVVDNFLTRLESSLPIPEPADHHLNGQHHLDREEWLLPSVEATTG